MNFIARNNTKPNPSDPAGLHINKKLVIKVSSGFKEFN